MSKPITREEAESVVHLTTLPGWKVFESYLTKQLESYRMELESSGDTRYLQGRISTYREIFKKLEEYAAKTREKPKSNK